MIYQLGERPCLACFVFQHDGETVLLQPRRAKFGNTCQQYPSCPPHHLLYFLPAHSYLRTTTPPAHCSCSALPCPALPQKRTTSQSLTQPCTSQPHNLYTPKLLS